jgi:hypothetical protein
LSSEGDRNLIERALVRRRGRGMFGGVFMEDMMSPHRWGGLAARYSKNRVALRLVDPITGKGLEFGRDERAESWLKHRFDPTVKAIHVDGGELIRTGKGKQNKCAVHLDIQYKSGARVLEYVTKTPVGPSKRRDLNALAAANGAVAVVRHRDEIRSDMTLIANLRLLRQAMQLQRIARNDQRLVEGIQGIRETTRRDFLAANPGNGNYLDAFLGFKHCEGVLTLDLKGGLYGDDTRISRAA